MARKFWEKLSNQRIQFYDEPQDLERDELDQQIADIQELLSLSDNAKALIVQSNPGIYESEEAFNDFWEGELERLADQRDYYDNTVVTVVENIDQIDHRWMSPADMSLGPGSIQSVCGEEVGNEAIGAIDGVGSNSWQHDVDEVHVIVFDLGYKKRIDGLRVKNTASPGNPLQLSNVDVDVAGSVNNLDNPESRVGTGLSFTDPGNNDRDLTIRNGRYVRVTIGSTGHPSNHITVRDFEIRMRPRTAGL